MQAECIAAADQPPQIAEPMRCVLPSPLRRGRVQTADGGRDEECIRTTYAEKNKVKKEYTKLREKKNTIASQNGVLLGCSGLSQSSLVPAHPSPFGSGFRKYSPRQFLGRGTCPRLTTLAPFSDLGPCAGHVLASISQTVGHQ